MRTTLESLPSICVTKNRPVSPESLMCYTRSGNSRETAIPLDSANDLGSAPIEVAGVQCWQSCASTETGSSQTRPHANQSRALAPFPRVALNEMAHARSFATKTNG